MSDGGSSYILFLPGIKRSDCEEIDFDVDVEDGLISANEFLTSDQHWMSDTLIEYEELPKFFISFDQWVKNTNLQCLGCSLPIVGMPWFIPLTWNKQLVYRDTHGTILADVEENTTMNAVKAEELEVMRPLGPFNCPLQAKWYLTHVSDSRITNPWESGKMLDMLVNKYYGLVDNRPDLPEAENKAVMIQHAGKSGITPLAYRELNEKKLQEFLARCPKKSSP